MDLHAREFASSSNEGAARVVLVHGAMDRHNAFLRVARRIAERHHVVVYDRRGYGQSMSVDPPADLERHVADLLSLVDDEPAVVVGHSMGGLVGLIAATIRPDRIRGVGAYEPPTPWKHWWPRHWDPPEDEPTDRTVENFYRRMVSDHAWLRMSEGFRRQVIAEGPALAVDLRAGRDTSHFDVEDVRVPVIVAHGSESTEHHIRAVTELADELADARLIEIEGARHGAHRSHPDAFAEFVDAVVTRSSGRRATT